MIEIITIGDELTSGRTVDENARFIGESLYLRGFSISKITTVGDGLDDISGALKNTNDDTRFIIATGGLGPTEDDKTSEAAARFFGKKLILNQKAFSAMERLLGKVNRKVSEVNKKQAVLPDGSTVISNPIGTACGFLIIEDNKHYIFLPGVPGEVRAMTESSLVSYLEKECGSKNFILSKTLKVFGLWESVLQEKLANVLPDDGGVSLAYYPSFPEISLKVTGKGTDKNKVETELKKAVNAVELRIGEFVYSKNGELLEEVVGRVISEKKATIAVAESCTGGLISHRITNVPGSSAYLERSFVVYSNKAKEEILNVPADILNKYGAVSEPAAKLMAERVRKVSGTTFGLAVTGIAGPSGGTAEKPVGTVYIAVSSEEKTEVRKHGFFFNDRERIKLMTSHMALEYLRRAVLGISIQ